MGSVELDGLPLTKLSDKSAKSSEQDQIAYVSADLAQHSMQNKCMAANSSIKFHSLQNDIFLGWSKLKAFADDKINVNEK